MLWDNTCLRPVRVIAEKRGIAIALTACDDLASNLRNALDLACFDVIPLPDMDRMITNIAIRKPDIIFLDERLVANNADTKAGLEKARTTETLPVLSISPASRGETCTLSLSTKSKKTEIFLRTRALIRRERPCALGCQRQNGALLLDEQRFKLSLAGVSVDLNKIEHCLLGPFFDLEDAVLDRQSLELLVFEGNDRKVGSRIVDFQISRMRRRLKAQLNMDPLRSVRGIGYAINRG